MQGVVYGVDGDIEVARTLLEGEICKEAIALEFAPEIPSVLFTVVFFRSRKRRRPSSSKSLLGPTAPARTPMCSSFACCQL